MKISIETKKRIKIYLAETVLACFGYAWIIFTYASFYLLVISGYESLGFFLTGTFSCIITVLGVRALNKYKETEEYKEMDLAENKRLKELGDHKYWFGDLLVILCSLGFVGCIFASIWMQDYWMQFVISGVFCLVLATIYESNLKDLKKKDGVE